MTNAVQKAMETHPDAGDAYAVQRRGRPELDPRDVAKRVLRRRHFGAALRDLREAAGLSSRNAARLAGISSARSYETTCYPPGEVVLALAPHYGVSVRDLSAMVLSHQNPVIYEGLTGEPAYEPEEDDVNAYIRENKVSPPAKKGSGA